MKVESMKYRKVSDLHPLASNPRKITSVFNKHDKVRNQRITRYGSI